MLSIFKLHTLLNFSKLIFKFKKKKVNQNKLENQIDDLISYVI